MQPELVVMVRVNVDNVDVSSGRAVKYSPEVMAKIEELTTPYFVRTMYNAMVFNGHRNGGYHMELPAPFVKEHGDKIHRRVTLEGPTGEVWKVRLKIQISKIQARVSFAAGWRDFSHAHQLERGDLLLFSVVAESKFVVHIFSQAGKLVQRRSTNAIRHREKFPSHTLRFSDDDSSPSESEPSSPISSPKRKAKRSRLPGSTRKKESNLKSRANRKADDTGRTKKRRRKILYSETEAFKLLEEVAGGGGKVSHIIDGKLVAWEKVDQDCSSECVSPPSAIEIPEHTGPSDPSPGTNTVTDVAEAASWPTWLQLFGLKEQK